MGVCATGAGDEEGCALSPVLSLLSHSSLLLSLSCCRVFVTVVVAVRAVVVAGMLLPPICSAARSFSSARSSSQTPSAGRTRSKKQTIWYELKQPGITSRFLDMKK